MASGPKPLLLDLFCGAGGAGAGYARAGFDVVGVDWVPQPHYPFEFHQFDVRDIFKIGPLFYGKYDAIHTSPPCQPYSRLTGKGHAAGYDQDLLVDVRENLQASGKPYIIENVEGAPLLDPVMLCGTMFGLRSQEDDPYPWHLKRHRLFETNFPLTAPAECDHRPGRAIAVYGRPGGDPAKHRLRLGSTQEWKTALGIDWMNSNELPEAIPPAYTTWVGQQLLSYIR